MKQSYKLLKQNKPFAPIVKLRKKEHWLTAEVNEWNDGRTAVQEHSLLSGEKHIHSQTQASTQPTSSPTAGI